jgi:hypothetical protein
LSANPIPPQAAGAAPQAPIFNHPRLQELLKKASAVPGVGAIVMQTIYDLVHPQDRILVCYYQFEATVPKTPTEAVNNFYSCEVTLVTSAYYINITIFPKAHTYRKKKIHTIGEVSVKYDPPSMEDIKGMQVGKFVPNNLTMNVVLHDEKGNVVDTWQTESTHPEAVRNLLESARMLNKCVGYPLGQIAQQATATQANA